MNSGIDKFSKQFVVENRAIGCGQPVYIIAEAGISHFGDEAKAYELVNLAVEAGADAVKFQVFDIDAMITGDQKEWRERLGSRQLPYESFERIQAYCKERAITFFATAHDEPSLDFLIELNVPVFKIGSGEVGNWPYFKKIAALGKPVIFSTGMYQSGQISDALQIFHEMSNPDIAVLHCITSYPTNPADVNLNCIREIEAAFKVITGYSDHTQGYHIPLAAVALGARIIEKHITLEFDIPNAQDWKVSCGPADLHIFVNQVREIEETLRSRAPGPTATELDNQAWATKSLVLKRSLSKGSKLSSEDLVAKRPGTGISPSRIDDVIGTTLNADLKKDTILKWENLN